MFVASTASGDKCSVSLFVSPSKNAHNVPDVAAHRDSQHSKKLMPTVHKPRIRDNGQAGEAGRDTSRRKCVGRGSNRDRYTRSNTGSTSPL
jgi:hypothetical protein